MLLKIKLFLLAKRTLRKIGLFEYFKAFFSKINPKYAFYKFKIIDVFKDSNGNEHEIYESFRLLIYPNAEKKFRSSATKNNLVMSNNQIIENYSKAKYKASIMSKTLRQFGIHLQNKTILDIGCYAGFNVYHFNEIGCKFSIGSDFGEYYVAQNGSRKINSKEIEIAREELTNLRLRVKEVLLKRNKKFKTQFLLDESKIKFIEDDISNSKIENDYLDIICSWQVMEHVRDPRRAFQEMFRILKPGGIAYHVYSSFCHFVGGHSLCTLDFPWGHCRLSPEDFERYLKKYRPNEYEVATRFYHQSLNRISIKQSLDIIRELGFKLITMNESKIKWPKKFVDKKLLDEIHNFYPDIVLNDLLSSIELVIAK